MAGGTGKRGKAPRGTEGQFVNLVKDNVGVDSERRFGARFSIRNALLPRFSLVTSQRRLFGIQRLHHPKPSETGRRDVEHSLVLHRGGSGVAASKGMGAAVALD
jgi:hypothetical protein